MPKIKKPKTGVGRILSTPYSATQSSSVCFSSTSASNISINVVSVVNGAAEQTQTLPTASPPTSPHVYNGYTKEELDIFERACLDILNTLPPKSSCSPINTNIIKTVLQMNETAKNTIPEPIVIEQSCLLYKLDNEEA